MFDMNKEKFGTFVSALRKEKGMTQKEVAAALFVSDKAVSKWETGQSVPDVSLLIPLSEILGVTVTELLKGERIENTQPIPAEDVESLVKKAVSMAEEKVRDNKKLYTVLYTVAVLAGVYGFYYMNNHIYSDSAIIRNTMFLFVAAAAIGAYFIFFAANKLPQYYDSNRISSYSHGPLRMNIYGVNLNNSNWPHIVKWLKNWSVVTVATSPFVTLVTAYLVEYICVALSPSYPNPLSRVDTWENTVMIITYLLYLGSMVISIYVPGRKYE